MVFRTRVWVLVGGRWDLALHCMFCSVAEFGSFWGVRLADLGIGISLIWGRGSLVFFGNGKSCNLVQIEASAG
ncbi:hypothetical protein VNO80_18221 [Phaseolus coccineus]|uniref:Uncharacterized protein n=1 Tax=Phaseolus coccineus TaxID=3886 RepID=A0AAN9MIZ0_PHACN